MIIQLLLIAYVAFVMYRVWIHDMSIADKDTWIPLVKYLKIPPKDDTIQGTCRLYVDDDNVMDSRGELVTYSQEVPCSECNQYVYRKNGDCILYKHEPSEIVGKCVKDELMEPARCHFQNSSEKSIFSTVSSIFA